MKKEFWKVRARVTCGDREVVDTFWANHRKIAVDTITFTRCDEEGCNDLESIAAGNGGMLTVFVLKVVDIIWQRPAVLSPKYGCLEVKP